MKISEQLKEDGITLHVSRKTLEAINGNDFTPDPWDDANPYAYCTDKDGNKIHIDEYRKMLEQGKGSFDFYSDWYKDLYGVRPRGEWVRDLPDSCFKAA